MRKTTIFLILILTGLGVVAEQDEVAKNLQFLVAPMSDDPEDYKNAERAAFCISDWIQDNWSPERIDDFSAALDGYVSELTAATENVSSLVDFQLPEHPVLLKAELGALEQVVANCEEKFGVNLEY